jgi:transposase InsO family protein
MNIHKNARLTPYRREDLVTRATRGESVAGLARQFGVSLRTARKWLARYRAEGVPGLQDRSSRPHVSPRSTAGHRRTRPYTPRTNGKAERFIQTALREWAYIRPFYTSAARAAILPGWLEHYNCARPHGSLDGQPPMSRLPRGNNLMLVHT